MLTRRRILAATLGGAVALAASSAFAQSPAPEKLPVVASFSILGDLARQVGGDRVAVTTLVGPGGDAHVFEPTPADAKALAAARLVLVNGLGFEGWMNRLVKASGTRAPVVVVTKGITPLAAPDADDDHDHAHGKKGHDHDKKGRKPEHAHDHGAIDPHAWQSIANAKIYVDNIRDALAAADPAGREAFAANAAAYIARLDALDAEVRAAMAAIPEKQRAIITSHDAFGYFANAYGLKIIAPQGVSTESEASARDVARIIRQIKAAKIPAVFMENISDPRLLDRIAKETGARIGGELYSDALSDDKGPASTYIDMMRSNVRTLSSALSS